MLKIYPPFLSRLFAKASRGATVVSSSEGTYLIFLISLISLHFYYMQAMQQPVFFYHYYYYCKLPFVGPIQGQTGSTKVKRAEKPFPLALSPPNQQVSPMIHSANTVFFCTLCVCTWGGGGEVGGVHIVNLGHPAAEAALQLMRGRDEGLA